MILVLDPDDKSLEVFLTEEDAISACEGIDVEELPIEFWDNEGKSLKADFVKPNKKSVFSVISGTYRLIPNFEGKPLIERLDYVSYIEGNSSFNSTDVIRK